MKTVLNWLLTRIPLVKTLDGYKTHIGFCLLSAGILLAALLKIAIVGAETYPGVAFFPTAAIALQTAYAAVGELFEKAGTVLIGIGVWHDKLKRS